MRPKGIRLIPWIRPGSIVQVLVPGFDRETIHSSDGSIPGFDPDPPHKANVGVKRQVHRRRPWLASRKRITRFRVLSRSYSRSDLIPDSRIASSSGSTFEPKPKIWGSSSWLEFYSSSCLSSWRPHFHLERVMPVIHSIVMHWYLERDLLLTLTLTRPVRRFRRRFGILVKDLMMKEEEEERILKVLSVEVGVHLKISNAFLNIFLNLNTYIGWTYWYISDDEYIYIYIRWISDE